MQKSAEKCREMQRKLQNALTQVPDKLYRGPKKQQKFIKISRSKWWSSLIKTSCGGEVTRGHFVDLKNRQIKSKYYFCFFNVFRTCFCGAKLTFDQDQLRNQSYLIRFSRTEALLFWRRKKTSESDPYVSFYHLVFGVIIWIIWV